MSRYIKDKKGFTLVELLVSLGLMGIVFTAIFSFFLMNYKSFIRTDERSEVQYQTQFAMNTIINSIIQAKGIVVHKDLGTPRFQDDGESIDKIIFFRPHRDANEKYYIVEHKDPSEIGGKINKLFYSTSPKSANPYSESGKTEFADYIEHLKIIPLGGEPDNEYSTCEGVEILIKGKKGQAELEIKNRVYFRNHNYIEEIEEGDG